MMGIRTMMDKQKLKCVDGDYDEDCDYDGWKDRQTDRQTLWWIVIVMAIVIMRD